MQFTEKEIAYAIDKCETLWQADEDRYKTLKKNALALVEEEGLPATPGNLFSKVYAILLTED